MNDEPDDEQCPYCLRSERNHKQDCPYNDEWFDSLIDQIMDRAKKEQTND